jgi:ABC-type branched-subunit amino acid transport system substrate-binding protein
MLSATAAKSAARTAAVLAAATVLLSACGLAPRSAGDLSRGLSSGGGQQVALGGGGTGTGATGTSGTGTGETGTGGTGVGATGTGATGTGGSVGGGTGTGGTGVGGVGSGTGAGGTGTGSGGTGSGTGTGGTSGGAFETTGIRNGVIYIGIHAPETGAAPIPLQAFQTGTKLFWENHTVFGHKVVMQFMDDQYNPSVARQDCNSMSGQDFLVIGGAGTDQIQACATDPTLAATHTPYLSVGVTTNGLTGLPDYFAISQTYAAQSSEVYSMTAKLYPNDVKQKWAIITENTPNFTDTTTSIEQLLSGQHIPFCVIRPPKNYSQSDASSAVTSAHNCGAKVAYLDVDPNFWIDMVAAASSQLFTPDWVGPGVTNGEDLVATPVCGEQATIKAAFLSPFMGLDRQPAGFSSENNPAPDAAPADRDIEELIYGTSEVVYNALLSVGSFANLTRDNFIASMSHFTSAYGRQLTVFPTINMAAGGGHFGSTGAWELQLQCSKSQYTTVGLA